jgi:hypothetical protein
MPAAPRVEIGAGKDNTRDVPVLFHTGRPSPCPIDDGGKQQPQQDLHARWKTEEKRFGGVLKTYRPAG